jgi:hypothetical protein
MQRCTSCCIFGMNDCSVMYACIYDWQRADWTGNHEKCLASLGEDAIDIFLTFWYEFFCLMVRTLVHLHAFEPNFMVNFVLTWRVILTLHLFQSIFRKISAFNVFSWPTKIYYKQWNSKRSPEKILKSFIFLYFVLWPVFNLSNNLILKFIKHSN